MNEKQLELKSVYELSPEELEELGLQEGEELLLFEGDPDYMVTPECECIYFFIRSDKNLVVVSDYSDFDGELLDFCCGRMKHWFDMPNSWDAFESEDRLKIAYRGGVGYVYGLFKYID